MTIDELRAFEKILLLGYGREGKVTKDFLESYCPNVAVAIADEKNDKNAFAIQQEFPLAIKSPGVPGRKVTIPYTTATNIFFANVRRFVPETRIIGVTGSKGKSTASSLIAHILQCNGLAVRLAGNIGKPMVSELLSPPSPQTIFVLELSSYMLEDIVFSPDVSVFLNIFPEHLDYHGGMEPYVAAKMRIQTSQQAQDFFVYDPEQELLTEAARKTRAQKRPWLSHVPVSLAETKLKGEHNLRNIRAAVTVAELFGISADAACEAVKSFEPLAHRLQYVATINDIIFYDDAIASAPEPTIEALKTLGNVDTIFLGGTDRGIDFTILADALAQSSVRNLVFFPPSGQRIKALLESMFPNHAFSILETKSMQDAVDFAYAQTRPGSICLLSTASPSYSLWKDFEAKGDDFQHCVKDSSRNSIFISTP